MSIFKQHVTSLLGFLLAISLAAASAAAELKPRVIVLTDIAPSNAEPDDMESMIRLMAHADLFEIEGLIATTGWNNAGGREHPELILAAIGAYEKDLPNLRKRSNQQGHLPDESKQTLGYWPSPGYLRSRTMLGSLKRGRDFLGKDNQSPGSDLMIKVAAEMDDRPIWVLAWGGANTLAQAIWQVRQEHATELTSFLRKLRVYAITDQDRGLNPAPFETSSHYWMRQEFSRDLLFIWDESAWQYQNGTGRANWDQYETHIQNHGHLGALYPKYRYGVEGDTPSVLHVWPNGLGVPDHPGYGGWGGFFVFGKTADTKTEAWSNHQSTSAAAISRKVEARFYPAAFNNFVARMNWAKDGAGNRNPIVTVNGDSSLAPIKSTPTPGTTVTLDASGSSDPDGDTLAFSWWIFTEAGTCARPVTLSRSDSNRATVQVPSDSAGKSFHVICEVTDSGTPDLTSYRRIIFEPSGPKR